MISTGFALKRQSMERISLMQATLLDYLKDAYLLEGTAEILAIQGEEGAKKSIVLKSTLSFIFSINISKLSDDKRIKLLSNN